MHLNTNFSTIGSSEPLSVALRSKGRDYIVLQFKQPHFHSSGISKYEAQCKGPGNEIAIAYTSDGSAEEIFIGYLTPNRKYSCKVSLNYIINLVFNFSCSTFLHYARFKIYVKDPSFGITTQDSW